MTHRFFTTLLSCTAGLAAVTAGQHAMGASTTLYSNLFNASSGSTDAATGVQCLTEAFTTDATVYKQVTATLELEESSAGSSVLGLYTDGGLQPGSLVGTFTSPSSYSTSSVGNSVYTLSSSALTANTTYWLVLTAPTGEFDWEFTSDNIANGNGLSPDAGTTWYTSSAFPYQMSVVGSTAVPEPAGVAAAAAGLLSLRRRRRAAVSG